jgi:glycine/D-amino acid oxidase-like deaminating enzyme
MKIERLPLDDNTNGWSAILPTRTPNPALASEITADWVVLGAGYAGLAAARRLSENCPDQQIAVIEAGAVGENASGRNSGFAVDLPHNVGSSLDELDGSQRFLRLAKMAVASLDSTIKTQGIDCEWSADGKYHTAVSRRGVKEVLEPIAKELEALGEPYEWIEKPDLVRDIGSTHFTAAIYTPGGALLNPAALTRGLADSLPGNVTLYENSPVQEASFENGVHFKTANGSLRGSRLIMAANGFSEQFGYYRNRFLHLVAHCSLTRQLTEDERKIYGVEKPWGLTPANAFVGITMRYTNDHRIVIRHGLNYCPNQRVSVSEQAVVKCRHKDLFDKRFPMLPAVEMEHTWSGFVCLSQNSAPGFGQLAPNVWSAVCQNAMGVTKGTFSGILAVDLACGRDNLLIADMQSLGEPSPLPPRPLLDIGVRARFMWEHWRNRHEA